MLMKSAYGLMKKTAVKAAEEAGKILMKNFGKQKEFFKAKGVSVTSVVTKADLESERKIVRIVQKKFPEHNILSEEKITVRKKSNYTWFIDPLDGTSNFARRIPLFGVSIGIALGKRPVLGVLYFPALGLLLSAEKGKGAFLNEKRLKVSKRDLPHALYYFSGYFGDKNTMKFLRKLSTKFGYVKIIGATSFSLAQIAMGDAEAFAQASAPHDFVAGAVIVEEAGGKATDYEGRPWDTSSMVMAASNGVLHGQLLKLIREALK